MTGIVEVGDGDEHDAETVPVEREQLGGPVDPPDRRPVFADVVARTDNRRPILPASLRSKDQRRTLYRWAVRLGAHTTAYHVTRTPKYLVKVAYYAPIGVFAGLWRVGRWAIDWETLHRALAQSDLDAYLKAYSQRDGRARRRLIGVGMAALLLAVAVTLLLTVAPWWWRWVALTVSAPTLAWVGRPADRRITDRVVTGPTFRKLTADMVRGALLATGYGKEPSDFQFPREIIRDGPGYSALVDLPRGVTAAMVMDRRERAAACPELRLPLDQVWMRPGRHAGQIELWVADEPISATKQAPWPLLKSGQADIFKPLPLGTDERGAPISVLLMFTNLVIGAIPRMGKTFVLRLVLLAACLDPRVKVGAADLKGTGDLGPLEPVASWYFVGDDEDELDALMEALRGLSVELKRRTKVIRNLPRNVCPESKVTPELAANKSLGLEPVVFGIDECQVLFTDEDRGKEAEKICTDLIKRGPAVGIILVLATQRPDAKSLPTGISGNAGMRFCLRVMGQIENDLVLGTSMYKNGIRATLFGAANKGMGWLVGALDMPVITRTFYVDGPMAERVVERAVQLRGGPVEPVERERVKTPAYNLLEDVRAVWPAGEDALWSELIVPRLAELRPDVYGDWVTVEDGKRVVNVSAFGAAMRAAGVEVKSVHRKIEGKGFTRYGVYLDALEANLKPRAIE